MTNEKLNHLLKNGFFPVTNDFWVGAELPHFLNSGFTWAFRLPLHKQRFMPYKSSYLEACDFEEIVEMSIANTLFTD